jgi:hypothetical protein
MRLVIEVPVCEECGVPEYIGSEHTWLSDGSIVHSRRQESRMAFIESETWDPIWAGLGELIGMPVERLVISSSQRATSIYMRKLIPDEVRERVEAGEQDIRPVIEAVLLIAQTMGYGVLELLDVKYERKEDDYAIVRYREPFSVPLTVASVLGTTVALTSRESTYEYDQVLSGACDIKVYPSEHPLELKARLTSKPYTPSAGSIELERCQTCGAPAALGEYKWDLERGVIRGRQTGRRMAMIGPQMIDPVFEELKAELGEEIPRLVVEAQRRFVRTGPFRAAEITGNDEMLRQFAIRGLGELTELHMGKRGVQVTLANSALHLWMVGMVQGVYELVFGEGSEVEWEFKDDGLLEIQVTPALE